MARLKTFRRLTNLENIFIHQRPHCINDENSQQNLTRQVNLPSRKCLGYERVALCEQNVQTINADVRFNLKRLLARLLIYNRGKDKGK